MLKKQWAIGVFDSGMGGLTVLRALKALLPQESFVYLGDTARLPYGTKSTDTVQQYAVQMTRVLVARQIKALVIACNTATIASLTYLQELLQDTPIIGALQPGAQAAMEITKNNKIAILATETTVASNAYQHFIQSQVPQAQIYARGCSLLVALAEEGMNNNLIAQATLQHYLSDIKEQDTILLGCTHFPVFKPLLQTLVSPHVNIVDSADAIASALKNKLAQINLLNEQGVPGKTSYLVTDSVRRFQNIGGIFLGQSLEQEPIELIDAVLAPEKR